MRLKKAVHVVQIAIVGCGFLLISCVPDMTMERIRSCSSLRPGDFVQLTDRSDQIYSGVFCEMKKMDFLEYVKHTQKMASLAPKPSILPVPGERIMFTTVLEPQHVWHGVLIGYCSEYLWVRLNGDTEVSKFYLAGMTRLVGWDRKIVHREELRRLIADNEVPMMTFVAIRRNLDTLRIALNDIKRIELITPEALAYGLHSRSGL
jgi:hypothetical protein